MSYHSITKLGLRTPCDEGFQIPDELALDAIPESPVGGGLNPPPPGERRRADVGGRREQPRHLNPPIVVEEVRDEDRGVERAFGRVVLGIPPQPGLDRVQRIVADRDLAPELGQFFAVVPVLPLRLGLLVVVPSSLRSRHEAG